MKYIDLSGPISNDDPEMIDALRTEITFTDHAAGAEQIRAMFGVDPAYLRQREGWAIESFTRFGTHNSTHVDAPWHYNSTIAGKPARTIDQLPLEWYHSRGVCLDFTHKADGDPITASETEDALRAVGHHLEPLDIVLMYTGRDAYYKDVDYMRYGPGVTAEATRWLYHCGVRVMGIDAWGWDRPLHLQAADVARDPRPGVFWESHQADLEYSQIERLVNLGALPATGFTICCFPLRIQGGSGAPARVVAIVDDNSAGSHAIAEGGVA
jgi:kynurenine formamidase